MKQHERSRRAMSVNEDDRFATSRGGSVGVLKSLC
jgi:hypothetical protein